MGNNKRNIRSITDKELSFKSLFYTYRKDHELISMFNFIFSLIISLVVVLAFNFLGVLELSYKLSSNILTVSAAIFGVILASFGLFAAITDKKFLELIHKLGEIKNILFPFWFCSFLWSVLLTYSVITGVLDSEINNHFFLKFHLFFSLFLFCICLGYTLSLIGDILKLTVHKANFVELDISNLDPSGLQKTTTQNLSYLRYMKFMGTVGFLIISFDMFLYFRLNDYQIVSFLTGGINLMYIFIYIKLVKILEQEQQKNLLILAKELLKILILYISICILFLIP